MQDLLSHPDKTLLRHLRGVLDNCRTFAAELSLHGDLLRVIELCAVLHDLGKASSYFQSYIRTRTPDGGPALGVKERKLTNHARISAWWTFFIVRRELESDRLALLACIAVLKHHGNFSDVETMLNVAGDDDKEDMITISGAVDYKGFRAVLHELGFDPEGLDHAHFCEQVDVFYSRTIRRLRKTFSKSPDVGNFFDLNLLFSILLSADKGEVIFDGNVHRRGDNRIGSAVVDAFKSHRFPDRAVGLNILREQVYQSAATNIAKHADKCFLSVNVPTGIGKTFTVLNAALKLRADRPDLKKIIYCLPFTSVIDQNARVFQDVLEAAAAFEVGSDALMIYHHLSERTYHPGDTATEIDDNRAEYLLHAFESEISVTTFYQLLHGILSGRNREVRKLHSFANSIIILDEVQSIPIEYWPLVNTIFSELAQRFNITFILVTATMPLIFDESKGEIIELVDNKEDVFRQMDRIDLDCSMLDAAMSTEEFADHLVNDFEENPDRSFLVVVNTRKCARDLFEIIRQQLDFNEDDKLFFLSTNVYPKERLRRIKEIKQRCDSRNTSGQVQGRTIVVSTQLVEAGVDIDLDVVYRDIAPLDSIFQACGRCNRNMRNGFRGRVKLIKLLNDKGKLMAGKLYGHTLINKTLKVLESADTLIPEADFYELSQSYQNEVANKIDNTDSLCLLEAIKRLQYDSAFDASSPRERKCPKYKVSYKAFELIKQLETVPVFIKSLDTEAQDLHLEFLALLENTGMEKFERMRAIKNINRAMSQFIVNVPAHYMPKDENKRFFIVDEYIQDLPYDEETGIQYGAQEIGLASI